VVEKKLRTKKVRNLKRIDEVCTLLNRFTKVGKSWANHNTIYEVFALPTF